MTFVVVIFVRATSTFDDLANLLGRGYINLVSLLYINIKELIVAEVSPLGRLPLP